VRNTLKLGPRIVVRVEDDGKMKEKRLADDGRKKRASRFLFWGRASQANGKRCNSRKLASTC
jgi:hypothetical protein